MTHPFIFMVDFPTRHVCGSIRLTSVYICYTLCKNWFYNLYHQLWWMGESQKSRGRKEHVFISSFRWWFLLKEHHPIFWPLSPILDSRIQVCFAISPHFLLNTSNVARLPHMGLKKKQYLKIQFFMKIPKKCTKIPFMIFISNGPYITKSHQGCFPTGASPRSSSAGGAQRRRGSEWVGLCWINQKKENLHADFNLDIVEKMEKNTWGSHGFI